ncbi:hypothetical protein GCM10023196_107770 [Actinoallomurus vinaceus]|uniref:Uncharacterized protein n=1 Tax=Actinoallomurus vinaceus TaxID=1080074 RepID=A0ABP8UWZ4_9ACTN
MTFDPYDQRPARSRAPRDPYERTVRDSYEHTVRDPRPPGTRDPLEDTVPDVLQPMGEEVAASRAKGGRRGRRLIEAAALLVLAPGLLVVQWVDDSHQAANMQPPERGTTVRRGQTGVLGHAQWRLLGRDTTVPARSSTTPAGAVHIKLILQVRPLDAQGVKNAKTTGYRLRDGAGHEWTGVPIGPDPVAGRTTQMAVTSDVPAALVNSVLLAIWQKSTTETGSSLHGLVFAH